jgi:hypothetical protein
MGSKKNVNAVALGSRGGKARAGNLSFAELSAIGKKGATARLKNLPAAERKEIARKAAAARWRKAKQRGKE